MDKNEQLMKRGLEVFRELMDSDNRGEEIKTFSGEDICALITGLTVTVYAQGKTVDFLKAKIAALGGDLPKGDQFDDAIKEFIAGSAGVSI